MTSSVSIGRFVLGFFGKSGEYNKTFSLFDTFPSLNVIQLITCDLCHKHERNKWMEKVPLTSECQKWKKRSLCAAGFCQLLFFYTHTQRDEGHVYFYLVKPNSRQESDILTSLTLTSSVLSNVKTLTSLEFKCGFAAISPFQITAGSC